MTTTSNLNFSMPSTIYQRIFKKLMRLTDKLDVLKPGDALKSQSTSYMDLHLDVLEKDGAMMVIALSHYYRHPSGDMIADPDMTMKINFSAEVVEALTYQDSFGFQCVYPDERHVHPKLKKSLNAFLSKWLSNCLAQGHSFKELKK